MNVKVNKDKQTGEMCINYCKVYDKALFRYTLLKKIFEEETDLTIIIDTNQRIGEMSDIDCENFLKQSGITHSALPTEANKIRYLGLPIDFSRKKKEEKLIIFHIISEQLTPELFDLCFKNFDVGIGIGGKKAFDDFLSDRRLNMDDVLFNASVFEKSIYDSVLCTSIRSSFDIEKYIILP